MSWCKRAVLSFKVKDHNVSLSQVRRSTVAPPPPAQMGSFENTWGLYVRMRSPFSCR